MSSFQVWQAGKKHRTRNDELSIAPCRENLHGEFGREDASIRKLSAENLIAWYATWRNKKVDKGAAWKLTTLALLATYMQALL